MLKIAPVGRLVAVAAFFAAMISSAEDINNPRTISTSIPLSSVGSASGKHAHGPNGEELMDDATMAVVEKKAEEVAQWGKDPQLVAAVTEFNAKPPAETVNMTQEKWKHMSFTDPLVKAMKSNKVGRFLRARQEQDPLVSEAFVSGSNGAKVSFLTMPTHWSHTGKPKHELPMKGQRWIGSMEIDESTRIWQIQVSVPVLAGDKPIGSIVVGYSVHKLKTKYLQKKTPGW